MSDKSEITKVPKENNLVDEIPGVLPILPPVSYTHLRAHETVLDLVCRLLLEKKNTYTTHSSSNTITS